MYVRLFRRRDSNRIFAQFCNGADRREVICLETSDPAAAEVLAREMLFHHGCPDGRATILWDCTERRTGPPTVVS